MAGARVGIVGYGVLGRQVEQYLRASRSGTIKFVRFDDELHARNAPGSAPFGAWMDGGFASCEFYVALGYRHLAGREEIAGQLEGSGRRLPPLVHPTAFVDPGATLGAGVIVFPNCTVGSGVTLSIGALLHCSVTLAHDDHIGAAAYVAPGVTLSGFVEVGARSFIGTGAVVTNGVKVGADARVGIGTCVTRDVAAGSSVIGNPMRVLPRPLNLE